LKSLQKLQLRMQKLQELNKKLALNEVLPPKLMAVMNHLSTLHTMMFSWFKVCLIFILLQNCTSLHYFTIKCWNNFCIYKVLTYSPHTDFYFVQLTFGISKCSVRLSRCLLNSSTLCLCVIAAFCLIRSFCWKKKVLGNWENGHQVNEHMPSH
jgi:hypothetical protein